MINNKKQTNKNTQNAHTHTQYHTTKQN